MIRRLLWLLAAVGCLTGYALPAQRAALSHPDQACATCHQAIYEQYKQTSMALGSGLAAEGLIPGKFKHQTSQVQYSVYLEHGQAWLSYERLDKNAPLKGTQQLLYFIGSGHRGRTYLFQQEGLWFESPINYYGKKQLWDMAPTYTHSSTMPFTMPVDPGCLHCHAGDVSASTPGVRNRYDGAPFASGGVGCAACHGNPASHLASEAAHKGAGVIVNPDKLAPAERDSTCLQCHLEGDAAIYKPARSLATYKPGENLFDSVVYFVDTSRPGFGGRASSQYEALLRSACRRSAGDRLTCTSCHDPHSSPAPRQRIAFYRSKCLACHTDAALATKHHPEQQDCAVCHMPTRDTQDISHEQLTDHDIERTPRVSEAALQSRSLGEITPVKPAELAVVGNARYSDRELGLAYAQLARHGDQPSGERALNLLSRVERGGMADSEVHIELGFLLQLAGQKDAAEKEYRSVLLVDSSNLVAMANLAVIFATSGRADAAAQLLRVVIDKDPSQTTAGVDLAYIECNLGQKEQALSVLQQVRALNPDDATVRKFLATGRFGSTQCDLRQKAK